MNTVTPKSNTPARLLIRLAAAAVVALTFVACSLRTMMISEMTGAIEVGMAAFEKETDLELLESAFPANIKLLENLLAGDPGNARLHLLLARMYAAYSFSFFEGRLDERSLSMEAPPGGDARIPELRQAVNRYYLRGADHAQAVIEMRYPGSTGLLARVHEVAPFLEKTVAQDVPALFWYGFNLGAYVNQNRDSIAVVAKAHVAEKIMRRIVELDETYFNGAAHLFLMIYYASRPPMMGGDPERALMHYRRLSAMDAGSRLLADVYFARHYLYRTRDRQRYEEMLDRVLTRDGEPGGLLDAVAVERARIYRAAAGRLFE